MCRVFSVVAIALQAVLGATFAEDLPSCFLLQTVAFVAFNKVATAQYFVWYLSWLPLVGQELASAHNRAALARAAAAWALALGHWLAWAYALEFEGSPVHAGVWVAGLLWLGANAMLLRELMAVFKSRR